jgi:hypothetical protein
VTSRGAGETETTVRNVSGFHEHPDHRRDRRPVDYSAAMTRLPDDPRLKELVQRAREELAVADPLGGALLIGETGRLPDGSLAAHEQESRRLEAIAVELDALEGLARDDELDRTALAHSLRRVLDSPNPRPPAGALLLERHLLAALAGLGVAPEPRAEKMAAMLESAPAFLVTSREGCEGAAGVAGDVALAAAKRLPRLLDLTAAAARALPLSAPLRQRIDAALGELLSAAAAHSGWLLKEYMPAADPGPPRLVVEPSGLDLSLDEIESAAEATLADQAGQAFEDATAGFPADETSPPAFPSGTAPRDRPGLAVVAAACRRVAALCDPWCAEPPGVEFIVEAQPSWLQPLLPPLALVAGGPLSADPVRLLVGDGAAGLSVSDLDRELAVIHAAEYLPASTQRAGGRVARLLLPASEALEGWRALVLAGAPGVGGRSRRELGWRAILALVAIGLGRGRLEVAEAGDLIAAETGMDPETAYLQAVHVAAQPAVALTFVAGAVAVGGALTRIARDQGEAAARAAILAAGPIPGTSINRLGYTP